MVSSRTAKIVAGGKRGVNWHASMSPHRFNLGEVISAVIKELRWGNEESALAWAIEMARSGHEAEEFLWECLCVFSVEDIGLANQDALQQAMDAKNLYFSIPRSDTRRLTVLSFLICSFARSKKTRYSSELMLDLLDRIKSGEYKLWLPDRAIDFHVPRGKQLGRGQLHYLSEAASLKNEDTSLPTTYRDALIKRAKATE